MSRAPYVVLEVDAVGDAVMCTAIAKEIQRQNVDVAMYVRPFVAPLLVQTGVRLLTRQGEIPENAIRIHVGEYLRYDCHRRLFPGEKHVHLIRWMALYIQGMLEARNVHVELGKIRESDVRLSGRMDSMRIADILAQSIGQDWESRTIILFHTNAGSVNRQLSPAVVRKAVAYLREYAEYAFVLLGPHPPSHKTQFESLGVPTIECELRLLPALFLTVNAIVTPDTGPSHIAAATLASETYRFRKQLIWVCTSSNPKALVYSGNQYVVPAQGSCSLLPEGCGWHGYTDPPLTAIRMDKQSKVACLYPEFASVPHTAPCTLAIDPKDIVKAILDS